MRRKRNRYTTKKTRIGRKFQSGLNFNRKKKGENLAKLKEILVWAGEIALVICVAAIIVFGFAVRVQVVGQSMAGTLENGERVLVNSLSYKIFEPKANDVIAFLPNGNEKSHYYIKRVIAVEGDTVQIIDGKVYVNDELFEEEIDNPYMNNGFLAEEPVIVGEDEYFVLGDNRNNSEDSRYANIGNVKKQDILGKVWFIYSPLDRFGFLK